MRFFPSKRQWTKWSLPAKLTAISCYVGAVALAITVIVAAFPYIFPPTSRTVMIPPSDEAVLCPHALLYRLEPSPIKAPRTDSPYAKMVVIEDPQPMFRVRIYTRTLLDDASLIEHFPPGGIAAVATGQGWQMVEIQAKGATIFKVALFANEDVKITCVERVN